MPRRISRFGKPSVTILSADRRRKALACGMDRADLIDDSVIRLTVFDGHDHRRPDNVWFMATRVDGEWSVQLDDRRLWSSW